MCSRFPGLRLNLRKILQVLVAAEASHAAMHVQANVCHEAAPRRLEGNQENYQAEGARDRS